MFFTQSTEPVMVQRYLPDVVHVDKRIILIDGKAVGAINRVPQKGEARSNLHVGGTAQAVELTQSDLCIVERIGAELSGRGLIFVGLMLLVSILLKLSMPTEFAR